MAKTTLHCVSAADGRGYRERKLTYIGNSPNIPTSSVQFSVASMNTPDCAMSGVLGHYRVLEKIGEGGMGVVYRAHDERLDRDVALKVLPAGTLTDEAARKRFRKEALALSKLNHPAISTIYDFDTQDGIDFLVMEYIPGVTLGERISEQSLPDREILQLATQLAEGLTAAHDQNIVHRDLKPGNLRITPDGRLKILDFGLATLVRPAQVEVSTASRTDGACCGTLPYMAPEQLQGQAPDVRSDIWAAGVVFYEMATGKMPFAAKLPTALTDEILHAPARPPSRLNDAISGRLEDVILKCLEKDPANRYQSSKELLVDLRRLASPSSLSNPVAAGSRRPAWRSTTIAGVALVLAVAAVLAVFAGRWQASTHIDSIAVLPLVDRSPGRSQDAEQEYFADGITEALIAELSKIKALKVISTTSVMRYKKTGKTVPQIAQELGVRGILEGSVTRAVDHVRISVEMIEARADRQIWAETYDRDLRDVLALQTEVARAIGAQIRVKATPQENARLTVARSVVPEAHEAYLKGRYFATRTAGAKSISWFQEAIAKDPNYAPAYAGLAQQYAFALPAHEFMPKAKAAALKAIELDESLAEAHIALAMVGSLYEWQWAEAEKECQRALELDPGSAAAHFQYAYNLIALGRTGEAVAEAEVAQKLDPFSLWVNMNYGRALYFDRRYDDAIAQFKRTLELDPNFVMGWFFLAIAEEQKGQYDEWAAHIRKSREISGEKALVSVLAGYPRLGYLGTLKAWAQLWEAGVVKGTVQPTSVAMLYARAGEKEKAFRYLEQGFREHSRSIVYIKAEPQFDNIRSDARFADLVRRMGFPK